MQGGAAIWDLKNKWLKAFVATFFQDTRRMIGDVAIEAEDDIVLIYGRARSFYAVQLAVHSVQTFNRDRSLFARTQLSLEVDGHSLELSFSHQPDRALVGKAAPNARHTRRELTFA